MSVHKKQINQMVHAVQWKITDPPKIRLEADDSRQEQLIIIDAIVNSASPDLMGGKKGTVDWEIHRMIDKRLESKKKTFNQKICKELSQGNERMRFKDKAVIKRVRCPRGQAVITGGYEFCRYVIHAVGAEYRTRDISVSKQKRMFNTCCSSTIQIMESCYHEIVKLIRMYPDIKNIAIPIMGSGNYGFEMGLAARIAVSSVGNALMEWKLSDPESFETSELENIIFFVKEEKEKESVSSVIQEYLPIYERGHQVVFQSSFEAQKQYYNEILIHDENRGYFAIAGLFRRMLLWVRMFFGILSNATKEKIGQRDWQRRSMSVEVITVVKLVFPIFGFLLVRYCRSVGETNWIHLITVILLYFMVDTVTYLAALIMMADIQKPSANVIRSLLLLFFNYAEVSLDMAFFYYVYYSGGVTFEEALEFGILDHAVSDETAVAVLDIIMTYGNTALKFFFLTLVFGYLVQHMHLRKFRGDE